MRKKFFVKPRLQLLQMAWMMVMVGAASVCGYIFLESIVSAYVSVGAIDPQSWLTLQQSMRWGFALVIVILIIVMGIENYFFFHRIVGPLFALERDLKKMAAGDFSAEVQLRTSDQLKELMESFETVKKELQWRVGAYDRTTQLLMDELDHLLENASVDNIKVFQKKLKRLREEVVKKAA